MSQQHTYNTRNGYMLKVSRPRKEWGRNKTYYTTTNDWVTAEWAQETNAKNDFQVQIETVFIEPFWTVVGIFFYLSLNDF